MKLRSCHTSDIAMSLMLVFSLALPAWAGDNAKQLTVSTTEAQPVSAQDALKKEKELQLYSDFARFSDSWVQRLNAAHSEGRSKMVVVEEGGTFRARYHHIEKKSSVVRESPSRPGKYCGILRYQDTVYQAEGDSEDASRNGEFEPVAGTARAYSEIFQFMSGTWR